jgi:hypothetical protein
MIGESLTLCQVWSHRYPIEGEGPSTKKELDPDSTDTDPFSYLDGHG